MMKSRAQMRNPTDAPDPSSGHTWRMTPVALLRRLVHRRPRTRMDALTPADRKRIGGIERRLTMRAQLDALTDRGRRTWKGDVSLRRDPRDRVILFGRPSSAT